MKRTIMCLFALVLAAVLSLPGAAMADENQVTQSTTLTWVAGGVGGGWYVQAGGIARMIAEKEPNLILKVVPGGGVVNPVRVSRHKDDLGWGITFVDKMAFKGIAPVYKKANPDVRSLGGIFGIYHIHVLGARDMKITTMAQMAEMVKAGKAIKVAAPMKGTSDLPLMNTILAFYGISLDDIKNAGGKVFHAVYSDMVNLYKDNHVDFVFTHLGLPGAAITEMSVSRDSTLISLSDACIDHLHNELGTLARDSGQSFIPKGTYNGQDADIPTVVSAGELIINKDVPDNVAYTITKIICENTEELYKINPANKNFKPETGWKNIALPLHPGAEKYYKDAGYME
ncbi:TRAP transporter, solute receptor (TAXI family protein) [Desulforapulum autotrophicum HRM2]|uniref:TRAP transporter, solute receptor (TAXI family protein) n=1 Tax=Desulforapulum autotrophicum (strain ATCC 43914 / DSM 3382 / VKM B-1955 / HRM2) TaxID=177437 RepID=C0QJW6_DESAH|nr:TAXI family TRAP transporter solute-binding subunit [Desulforapulum autotrophicum]ACN15992.1 TRAP transporter, solute receptor (TAXI family protein) [Desulforapulum autotrophicum HRM2]